ncbi:MAG: PQQ-binding-like beta-propeller repeat protein [Planctomycetota bacterium]
MFRLLTPALACCLLVSPTLGGTLIPDSLARRNGMTRAWFTQVQVNPSRNRVESVTLHGDTLVALTSAGVVHAIDALTGQTIWVNRIGNPAYPSLGPGVGVNRVALINGSTLYVLDRRDGSVELSRPIGGAPGGGPALTAEFAFIPLIGGRVEGFPLPIRRTGQEQQGERKFEEDQWRPDWGYGSLGRIFRSAVATSQSVMWSTDRSSLFVAAANGEGVRFRFDTDAPVVAPVAVRSPLVYAGSVGGKLYAVDELSGVQAWRYSAGFSIRQSPVVIGNTVIVGTDEPALHAIDAQKGARLWVSPGAARFVAASQERVYGLSDLGDLLVMDLKTGAVQARARNRGLNTAVLNDQTDRLYIYSDDGLLQCFHELGADEPYYHQPKPAAEEPAANEDDPEAAPEPMEEPADPFGAGPAADPFGAGDGGADPFGAGDEPADDPFGSDAPADDPFGSGAPAEDPFGSSGDDEDPFG